MHGEKVDSISGRLTVLHEVGVVSLQVAWSDVHSGLKTKFGIRNATFTVTIPTDMAAALLTFRSCLCTTPRNKQFPAVSYGALPCEFELPTAAWGC